MMGSLPMDNHFSKTTNNYPPDGHLSYKKKVPIDIDTAKVRVVEDGLTPLEVAQDAFAVSVNVTCKSGVDPRMKTCYSTPQNLYIGRPINSFADGCENIRNLTFGNLVESIPAWVKSAGYLSTVTIGNSIKEIPDGSFSHYSLTSVKIGANVTKIGNGAFMGSSLPEVVIPSSVEYIGEEAFRYSRKLDSIIMGCGVKEIGSSAFHECPAGTVSITAQIPPTAQDNSFSNYMGKLYLHDPGDNSVIDAYYDAYHCWDRFDSYVMIAPDEMKTEGETSFQGKPGDQIQLTATLWPSNVTLPHVFWRSTNPEVATVDHNGLVTIVSPLSVNGPGRVQAMDAEDEGAAKGCKIIAESLYGHIAPLEFTINANEDSGVEEVIDAKATVDIDYNAPYEVYTLSGMMAGSDRTNLAPGIYIIRQGNLVEKIAVK